MESAPPSRPGPDPGLSPPSRPARPDARALLVEDERVVGDLLAEFLTLEGYEVDWAMDGRQALELVHRRTYALIVSDMRMPDIDGPALYHELRLVSPDLTRRMVFITGDAVSPETRRFFDETCLRYLEKPFTIGQFQTVVRSLRGEAPSPGEPDPGPTGGRRRPT